MTEENLPPKRRATFIAKSSVILLREKSGILYKKSPKLLVGWQRRFFVLKDKKLYYYQDEEAKRPKGIINFDLVSVTLINETHLKGEKLVLSPMNCRRQFKLRATTKSDHQDWFDALSEHIAASAGSRSQIQATSSSDWWRFDRISLSQFASTAVTGDLLLFKSHNLAAKVQRIFTGASYDHVALILRYNDGDLGILEATSDNGVSILMWEDFLANNWQNLYSRLVLRHLEVSRDEQFVQDLELFITNNRNKAYGLSPIKLLSRTVVTPGEESTFFCSELVASAYMFLGYLSTSVPASQYWPGDFSHFKQLPMLNGAYLGEELSLDFSIP